MYALILAGGKGERLKPLTDSVPKPMVEVKGKPILWHQVNALKKAGIADVVFLGGYRWESIRDFFGDGSSLGVRASYSVEESPLGRGGAIKKGLALVPSTERTVLAMNGDILTSQEIAPMIEQHRRTAATATDMLVPYPSAYGVVEVDAGGRITAFKEKGELPLWINAGIYVLEASIAPELPDVGDHETSTFPALARQGRLYAFLSRAFWRAVDTHKDLREAEEALTRNADELRR
ncbi:MAG: nucleotidyltransferase family protein [Chloroflexi bacterium]|nr:nucleotidyltransferase family protein [Chloroflexota bacterium]